MTPDWMAKIFSGLLLFFFWLTAGILMAPFWLLIVIIGALIGAIRWKEVPEKFLGLITIKWFFTEMKDDS